MSSTLNNAKFTHPDLHYVFPTKTPDKKEGARFNKAMTAYYIDKWHSFLSSNPFGSFEEWLNFSSNNNKPGLIRVNQISDAILNLNLKPFLSKSKVCVIWGLDYLKEESANKLLKVLEEPPKKTYFFLIARDEKRIIPTVASRCQIIELPPIRDDNEHWGFSKEGEVLPNH